MIWFGGVSDRGLSDSAFHVTLKMDYGDDQEKVKAGKLIIKRLFNNRGEEVSLKIADRFFYNQEFYLSKPTKLLAEMGYGYQGKYTMRWFNKNRFIAVLGREAFHVFDLEAMDFIYADDERGYAVNIDQDVAA